MIKSKSNQTLERHGEIKKKKSNQTLPDQTEIRRSGLGTQTKRDREYLNNLE